MGKITIRESVFETNSSNYHAITTCSIGEFERFKKGEIVLDAWDRFVDRKDAEKRSGKDFNAIYLSYESLFTNENITKVKIETFRKEDKVTIEREGYA